MIEIWKDIAGYEGIYQVSNLGNVRSLDRYIINSKGSKCFLKGKLMKLNKSGGGYVCINLTKNGKVKGHFVHRLVAQAFIPNPHNLLQINHIDECITNNCVDNLEWCNSYYNTHYGTRNQRLQEKRHYHYYKRLEDGKIFKGMREVVEDVKSRGLSDAKYHTLLSSLSNSIKLHRAFHKEHYIHLS